MNFALYIRPPEAGHRVVDVIGEVDITTSVQLKDTLCELLEAGYHHLIVNLEQSRSIDSTGLGALILSLKRARGFGGSVSLVCRDPRVKKTFEVTGLTNSFRIFSDSGAAVEALGNVA